MKRQLQSRPLSHIKRQHLGISRFIVGIQGTMRGVMLTLIVGVFCLSWIMPAHAVLISVDDMRYGKNSLTRDTQQNLDFLDVNRSMSISYKQISTEFGVGGSYEGFRFSTISEALSLMNSVPGLPNIEYGRGYSLPSPPLLVPPLLALVDLLGPTDEYGFVRQTAFIFGSKLDEGFVSKYDLTARSLPGSPASIYFDKITENRSDQQIGHLLVRQAPSAVPEPSSVILLGSGLLGLIGYARRRKIMQE